MLMRRKNRYQKNCMFRDKQFQIEILIKLSNYYNISLDRLLKEDVVMKNKVIDDAKKKRKYRNIIKELVEVKLLSEKEYKISISHLVIRLA